VITVMPTTDRDDLLTLLKQDQLIDLVIPRGGEGLIRFVADNSRIPVIKHFKGVCHLYVDQSADATLALNLLLDGKCSRPAVCNALETLLVHRAIAPSFMPRALQALRGEQVEILGCAATQAFDASIALASDDDYAAEFLDRKITIKIVADADEAIAHIARFGSQHTEVIASRDEALNERFVREVDASSVMVNASSRFNDGGELGLGAEIGIATTKLHAYGPMGLESLTAEKFVVRGNGQIRHPQ
jgi:glutamate-5-semialdehyde dehydrogenase